ncbi:MAG: MOSC domain-containing protein [Pseudomonadota bacterium]
MPALKPTPFSARITWLGRVVPEAGTLRSVAAEVLNAQFDGVLGEAHSGSTRPSCSRMTAQHPKGTTIRNVRQLSVLSAEELGATAAAMGLDEIDPVLVGASMVIEGIPDFTHVTPSARLQGSDGVTLVIDMENRPCHLPAREIDTEAPGFGKLYKAAASGRRGVTAWVEREGMLRRGDTLTLHIPDQPVWAHLADARGLTARDAAE